MFVHGLGGSPARTWQPMWTVCNNDERLNEHSFYFYRYPSRRLLFPFRRDTPKLQELARGLATELEVGCALASEVCIVAYSLGGLIARQYVVNELKAGRQPKCNKLLLYATPNTGTEIARAATQMPWNQRPLAQLCYNADILSTLNDDWLRLKVEDQIEVKFVVGGQDPFVGKDSAAPFGLGRAHMLINDDHHTIIKPEHTGDVRYAVLRHFVLPKFSGSPGPSAKRSAEDPLFEVYNAESEPFYVRRGIDEQIIRLVTMSATVWATGPSGVGKTAAITRAILASGWRLQPVMLGGQLDLTPIGLLRAVAVELADVLDVREEPLTTMDQSQLLSALKRLLRKFPVDQTVAIFVDEFPLRSGSDASAFAQLIWHLSGAIHADPLLRGRVVLAFASINDIKEGISGNGGKILERFQFLPFATWTEHELTQLVDILAPAIRPSLPIVDRAAIVQAAGGSPRFVKLLFRRWRYGTDQGLALEELIESVRSEQV